MPDQRDFDAIVAAETGTGVVSGCAVTQTGAGAMSVDVALGAIVSAGVEVAVTAGTVTITAADVTNPRFDLIVASSAGVKSAVAGTPAAAASATQPGPVFPAIPAASVLLAAVYVPANAVSILTADIQDKRAGALDALALTNATPLADVHIPAGYTASEEGLPYIIPSGVALIIDAGGCQVLQQPNSYNPIPQTDTEPPGSQTIKARHSSVVQGLPYVLDAGEVLTIEQDGVQVLDEGGTSKPSTKVWPDSGAVIPFIFWSNTVAETIPDNLAAWTPVNWDNFSSGYPVSLGEWYENATGSTTIAAGSDTAILPQATINVASTAGFKSSGYFAVRIGGKDVVISYTGINATQFTGCANGVGTLATGQVVNAANTRIVPPRAGLYAIIAQCSFAASATGARGIRIVDDSSGAEGAKMVVPATAAGSPSIQVQMQFGANTIGDMKRVDVFQSSGGALDVQQSGILTPALMVAFLGPTVQI